MRRSACRRCRAKKLKCDELRPCSHCQKANEECNFGTVRPSAGARLLQPADLGVPATSQPAVLEETNILDLTKTILDHAVHASHANSSAIPGSHTYGPDTEDTFQWRSELPFVLPGQATLDILTQQYFLSVNWFMHVIDEESFKQRMMEHLAVDSIPRSNHNFSVLICLTWALGSHYLWTDTSSPSDRQLLATFRAQAFQYVESNTLTLMSYPDIESVQVGILLGSFHLFNGLPNLGFALLGSTIKTAQLIGLHRGFSRSSAGSGDGNTYAKVWWALEIFEKYAAIAFGRPCGIDDSDCEVPEIQTNEGDKTNLTYHIQKCRLYRIIGTFLGRRKESRSPATILDIQRRLQTWFDQIPNELKFSWTTANNVSSDIIRLQALALQLAYDNIQIVLHRQAVFGSQPIKSPKTGVDVSTKRLRESALRTSYTPLNDTIVRMCQSSHAAMHAGICLFTAGVVLSALFLADSATPRSEELLQGLDRIVTFFDRFPDQGLAVQYSEILRTLQLKCQRSASPRVQTVENADSARTELAGSILESTGWTSDDFSSLIDFENTSSTDLLDYASGSSFDLAQAWLWSNSDTQGTLDAEYR